MNESDYNQLREQSWRRKLTPTEEAALRAWLAEHPNDKADWDADVVLTRALDKLSDAPVPSNFTARVLQAVEREAAADTPLAAAPRRRWFLHFFLPRVAAATVVLGAGLFTYHEHVQAKRLALVQGVKLVSNVPSLPTPEILQDFETIRQLNPGPDQDLLALNKDLLALKR